MNQTTDAIALVGHANRKSLAAWKKLVGVSLAFGSRQYDRAGAVADLEDALKMIESALLLLKSGELSGSPDEKAELMAAIRA